jgi:hypothetical protein
MVASACLLSGMAVAAGLFAEPFPDVFFLPAAPAANALRLSENVRSVHR